MEDPICPACKAVNDSEAAYCDQCGQHLRAAEAPKEGGCPACGAAVEIRADGDGVCSGCGLALVATPDQSCCETGGADSLMPERLAAAILQRTRAGVVLERAVAEACSEVLRVPAPARLEPEGSPRTCPLCAAENPAAAPQCAGCGIWFEHLRAPQACPRCERSVSGGGACACGALLTLPALLRYVEPSVRCVCSLCKQPYAVIQQKCPDCGGGMIGAERLKAYAASLA